MTQPNQPDANSLLFRDGIQAVKFPAPGAFVEGTILDTDTQQATELVRDPLTGSFKKGDLKFFKSGDPIWEIILTLQTAERTDEKDDGKRKLYVSSVQMQHEISRAIKEAGGKLIPIGGKLRVTFLREEGVNRKKVYAASVVLAADAVLEQEVNAVAQPEPAPTAAPVVTTPGLDPALAAQLAANPELAAALAAQLGK